ncbi:MAG: hypothetical protein MMC33_010718 [Icmadophila ericetorum]|nr:hypothetical protein [Icmadophila ericetorum]
MRSPAPISPLVPIEYPEPPDEFVQDHTTVIRINGTSGVRSHLEEKHQIDSQSGVKRHSSVRKSVLDQQKGAAAANNFFWKDVENLRELLIRWIVYCHIGFFQLENPYFRELLFFLNPALLNHLPKAAKTIRTWVMNAFLSKK